jgi:hypothetical protein
VDCIACDVTIRGTMYALGNKSPLCRNCCFELEDLAADKARRDAKKANRAVARDLSLLGRLFRGIFGGR